ncbi:MAG: tRNA (adenine-N1)-methyltransferase [Candidatus Methanomethylicia archaeon]
MVIKEGDFVLLVHKGNKWIIKVEKNKIFHTHRGFIDMNNIIGKEYGTIIKSSSGYDFYVFYPLMRDFIMQFRRKTQIIYPKDIAIIVLYADIRPGKVIVEGGTGSGALTVALASLVSPTGKVYSYDINIENLMHAKRNIEKLGLNDVVEFKVGDVTKHINECNVDVAVLDIPTPWLAVPIIRSILKPSGVFVSFSPTIEQVIQTVNMLESNRFSEIECYECIMRQLRVRSGMTRPFHRQIVHTGYIVLARSLAM